MDAITRTNLSLSPTSGLGAGRDRIVIGGGDGTAAAAGGAGDARSKDGQLIGHCVVIGQNNFTLLSNFRFETLSSLSF